LARYDCVQPRYNLISRAIEPELLPLCLAQGVGVIVYNPLAGGMLTGKHQRQAPPATGTRFETNAMYRNRYWQGRIFDAVDRFRAIAADCGHSMAQVALAWTLANPAVTSAILGASRVEQLDETLPATEIRLGSEQLQQLGELWEIVGRREF
jgi:aryl-alcohol dehydrogenase (NADP+)